MPLAFIGVVVLAVVADIWLYRTRSGLAFRAVGLDETASRRLGMGTSRTVILAFVVCSVMASIAGFYLAAEVQIGSPIIGNQALESIAAAVLGGASLAGGKGSFVGALLAALFLSLIDNVLPLFQAPTEYAEMTIGILILLALVLYQAPELLARLRSSWGGVGRLRAGPELDRLDARRDSPSPGRTGTSGVAAARGTTSRATAHSLPASRRTHGHTRSPSRRRRPAGACAARRPRRRRPRPRACSTTPRTGGRADARRRPAGSRP